MVEKIRAYLDYYLNLSEAPGSAFLINGSWGSGKTHFIKAYLEEKGNQLGRKKNNLQAGRSKNKTPIYISLNGVENVEQIDWAIAKSRVPIFNNKYVSAASHLGMGFLKAVLPGAEAAEDFKIPSLLSDVNARVFIFDDVERCILGQRALFGYLNFLIEHAGCWLILIADEDRLGDEFPEIKEKIVGHTITLQSNFDDAFANFCQKRVSLEAQNLFLSRAKIWRSMFYNSATNNLRVLEQTIILAMRILDVVRDGWDREKFIDELISLIIGLSFDTRTGRLKRVDLNFNALLAPTRESDPKRLALKVTADRYGFDFFADSIFSDELWEELLFDGTFCESALRNQAERSIHFSEIEDQPSWRILWHYLFVDDDLVESTLRKMAEEFNDRKWRTSIEFLHVVGIQLRFSRERIIEQSPEEVAASASRYIDSAFSDEHGFDIALLDSNLDLVEFNNTGLGVMERDSKEFAIIKEYLKSRQLERVEEVLEEKAKTLFARFDDNPEVLDEYLDIRGKEYEKRSFLHFIDVEKFAWKIYGLKGGLMHDLAHRLGARAQSISHDSKEVVWFESLRDSLHALAQESSPVRARKLDFVASTLFEKSGE